MPLDVCQDYKTMYKRTSYWLVPIAATAAMALQSLGYISILGVRPEWLVLHYLYITAPLMKLLFPMSELIRGKPLAFMLDNCCSKLMLSACI